MSQRSAIAASRSWRDGVLLDGDGVVVAEGHHRGAGTPHAEAAALIEAGDGAACFMGAKAATPASITQADSGSRACRA